MTTLGLSPNRKRENQSGYYKCLTEPLPLRGTEPLDDLAIESEPETDVLVPVGSHADELASRLRICSSRAAEGISAPRVPQFVDMSHRTEPGLDGTVHRVLYGVVRKCRARAQHAALHQSAN